MSGFWVFGYGSLMWRPGFDYEETCPALVRGFHRSLCVRSIHYRGTPERPGLVLGLAKGGACRGRAFRVRAEDREAVVAYLHAREMVTNVYIPRTLPCDLDDGRSVRAHGYVADPTHPQYAGDPDPEAAGRVVAAARGDAGHNIDYVANTVAHLEDLGIHDAMLAEVLRAVERISGRAPITPDP